MTKDTDGRDDALATFVAEHPRFTSLHPDLPASALALVESCRLLVDELRELALANPEIIEIIGPTLDALFARWREPVESAS